MTKIMKELNPLAALMCDLGRFEPSTLEHAERFLKHVHTLVEERGMPVIMIDFPALCTLFETCLDDSSISPEACSQMCELLKTPDLSILDFLLSNIFDESGYMKDEFDPTWVWFIRCIFLLYKKVDIACPAEAINASVIDFIHIDSVLNRPTLSWDEDSMLCVDQLDLHLCDALKSADLFSEASSVLDSKILDACQKVADIVISQFPVMDYRSVKPNHGPGRVSDLSKDCDKYAFPNWPEKLGLIFPYTYFGESREDAHVDDVLSYPGFSEHPARLCAVPKTLKSPRLITIEPVAHQYIQHGVLMWMRDNLPPLLRVCLDFKSQEPSRSMALLASATGEYATVDLKSASDYLSCWVVERVFRRNPSLLNALHACRTRYCKVPFLGGSYILLNKYAGQGNATTFPVQSICYSIIAIASVLLSENLNVTFKNIKKVLPEIRVFGDDIIIPSSSSEYLIRALSLTGFRVNVVKSHVQGHFRESCGMDAFKGVQVTPVYLRSIELDSTKLTELTSWLDVANNAHRAGLWELADYLLNGSVPLNVRDLIPVCKKVQSCLSSFTFVGGSQFNGKMRMNKNLHHPEILAFQEKAAMKRREREDRGNLLQYFIEERSSDFFGVIPPRSIGVSLVSRRKISLRWVQSNLD